MSKRIFDVVFSVAMLMVLIVPIAIISVLIELTSPGSCIHWSDRVGKNHRLFRMPKFRTMRIGAPIIATHLMEDASSYVTSIGRFLRRTSLDELPQLWSILIGDMSLVGPRPALFNQNDLIEMRSKAGVDKLTPGLTGWAQINGRDDLSNTEKVKFDAEYLCRRSFWFDLKIITITIIRVLEMRNVGH